MSRLYYTSFFLLILITGMKPYHGHGQVPVQVSGVVLNERGDPLGGISISLEGVLVDPVIADSSGHFTISAPSGHQWLIISPAEGYKRKRIYLNGRENLTVMLSPSDMASGDDVVLDIFHEGPKRNLISSTQAIQPGTLRKITGQTVDESIQGNIAGAYAIMSSGMPSSGVVNYIRGIKSMNTNNQPLYVIDGMPLESPGIFDPLLDGYSYNPLTSLDPNRSWSGLSSHTA